MSLIITELISAILQVLVFSLIPFVFFLFRKDKSVSFFRYIGLYRAPRKAINYSIIGSLLFLAAGVTMVFIDDGVRQLVITPPSVTGKIRQVESSAVAAVLILIVGGIKTSFSEEIFFRGFMAKRLIQGLGFSTGNIVQSLIFGLMHLALFWTLMSSTVFALIFIFVFSTLAGWVIGLIKEKHASGSIIPGWIAHAMGNIISYSVIVFVI